MSGLCTAVEQAQGWLMCLNKPRGLSRSPAIEVEDSTCVRACQGAGRCPQGA